MSKSRSKQSILSAISPATQRRQLTEAQRAIDSWLVEKRAQILLQLNSTFGDGMTCSQASWSEFADKLIEHGRTLIELGERLSQATRRNGNKIRTPHA